MRAREQQQQTKQTKLKPRLLYPSQSHRPNWVRPHHITDKLASFYYMFTVDTCIFILDFLWSSSERATHSQSATTIWLKGDMIVAPATWDTAIGEHYSFIHDLNRTKTLFSFKIFPGIQDGIDHESSGETASLIFANESLKWYDVWPQPPEPRQSVSIIILFMNKI